MGSSRSEMRVASLFLLMFSSQCLNGVQAQLSPTYYAATCPNVEQIANTWFIIGVAQNLLAPASILRLAFHDCAVNGCDGSVLLNAGMNNTDEKASPLNIGIGNLYIIDGIKSALETQCPGVVSCADIITLAARDAVRFSGGPKLNVRLGRRDGTTASKGAADSQLLPGAATVNQVLSAFSHMGINTMETVALLGAHTLGVAHCVNIQNRLYPRLDSTLQRNFLFASSLLLQCPAGRSNPGTVLANDGTNVIFDTQYFRDVLAGRGLMSIDAALGTDPRTASFVRQFASNRGLFFSTFQSAFTKMTSFKVLTGTRGIIRKNCRMPN